jgi:indolepyruvate ferredoxin oxidoreductase, beta subunit
MAYNIYLCGVGGQGIGVLSAALALALDKLGKKVLSCDTHGLAQRGGVVSSHIRVGDEALTPLVPEGGADLVLALERLEALRGAEKYLKEGGAVVYYDSAYQPVGVRGGRDKYPSAEEVQDAVAKLGGKAYRACLELPDPRMQNAALLGRLASLKLVPGLGYADLEAALRETLPPAAAETSLKVYAAGAAL